MSMSTGNNSLYDASEMEISIPRPIRFWLLLLTDIPSVVCSIFVLYHLFVNGALRRALHNHVIIALLISVLTCQLMDIPLYLTFIRLNQVWPQTQALCFFWWYLDVGIYNTWGILVAWASVERHILVFHDKCLSTRKRRFLVHYLPLFITLGYSLSFYLLALLIPPCEHNSIDYAVAWCHYSPCYYYIRSLHMWDVVVNKLLPSLFIAIFNVALLCRILWQKHYILQQPIVWRKYRKMAIQLMSLSAVYLIFNSPLFIVQLCNVIRVELNPQILFWLDFFSFFTPILLPFVCYASLPTKLRQNASKTLTRSVPKRNN